VTTLAEQYFSALFLLRNEKKVTRNCSNEKHMNQNNKELKLETLVLSVGENLHATIHVILGLQENEDDN